MSYKMFLSICVDATCCQELAYAFLFIFLHLIAPFIACFRDTVCCRVQFAGAEHYSCPSTDYCLRVCDPIKCPDQLTAIAIDPITQHSGPAPPTSSCLTLAGQWQNPTKFRSSPHDLFNYASKRKKEGKILAESPCQSCLHSLGAASHDHLSIEGTF